MSPASPPSLFPLGKDRIHIRATWRRFQQVVGLLLRSKAYGRRAKWHAASLATLILIINGLNVGNSFVGRYFMSAIEQRNLLHFELYALFYIAVFLLSSVVLAFYRYSEESFGILWREQLTRELTGRYLNNRTYHKLETSGVANPDQRIADDVRAFTTTSLSFSLLIVNGTVTAILFSSVLWSISPALYAVAVGYAICGSLITILLGKRLIKLNYHQLDMEANFRSDLIHVRENSELIALAHREGRFKARLNRRIDQLARNFRELILTNRNVGFFTNGYNYFIQIIPAVLIAPMFIAGKQEFGVITQSTMAFATLLGAISIIVTQFQSISTFTAVTARLHALSEAIVGAHELTPCTISTEVGSSRVIFQDVTLRSSDQSRVLVANLDLDIRRGARWLITAKDDAQKVALFRATAGIWECGSGSITRPDLDDILFLPERPYVPPGTLREVLLRTGMEKVVKDEEIRMEMERLGVADIIHRAGGLDAERDWDELLSIGEQHLLSVARILLAKPAFAFLDRPGSALPTHQISTILEAFELQGIGAVVLSKNGESQLRYDSQIDIHQNGTWEIKASRPTVVITGAAV